MTENFLIAHLHNNVLLWTGMQIVGQNSENQQLLIPQLVDIYTIKLQMCSTSLIIDQHFFFDLSLLEMRITGL